MNEQNTQSPQFFLTAPSPCPYLPGQYERKIFTHLVGAKSSELNDVLTQGGFRRSQNIAYRPACENCKACVSVRICADQFKITKSMRRVWSRNSDIIVSEHDSVPSTEQYKLFNAYINVRHKEGGMNEMSLHDYAMMVEDTHVNTRIFEYRIREEDSGITGKSAGKLIGIALSDILEDGLSMVYSSFLPEEEDRSLGTYIILDHIERTKLMGQPHVYLGYWVKGSPKMTYKERYLPQEHLGATGWQAYQPEKN